MVSEQDNRHDNYHGAPGDGRAWEPGSGEIEIGTYRVIRDGGCDDALGLRLVKSL